MEIVGWIAGLLFALWFTFMVGAGLWLGGEEFSGAKSWAWFVFVPIVIAVWWFVLTNAPFVVVVGG